MASVDQGQGHRSHGLLVAQGYESNGLPDVQPDSGAQLSNEAVINPGKDEKEKKIEENQDKDAGESAEEGDENEYEDDCPYKDSKLERFKCSLPVEMTEKGGSFHLYLEERADKENVIFLISIDSSYVEMALNLYETSFKRLGISNFLYVCSDTESAQALDVHNIDCYLYEQNIAHDKASRYMSKDFVRKTHVKTKIILAALYLGYNVFITDADIVFFKNPQLHLNCSSCDIEIQSDHVEENSGFYMARPTEAAKLLHQRMMDKANQSNRTSNQKALNNALKKLKRENLIKVGHMDKYRFPCGIYYFERFKRMWAGDNVCSDCVIVHNNWIMGKQAKVYRFKDHLLWVVDHKGYYSDPNRKYLSYSNPTDWGDATRNIEVATLKLALQIGHLINRTVILPGFTCRGCRTGACKTTTKQCSLNTHLRVSVFDGKFSGLYREHTFLSHAKVPKSVKMSVSPTIVMNAINAVADNEKQSSHVKTKLFIPKDTEKGATVHEILHWFGEGSKFSKYSVLKFSSLYNSFRGLDESNSKYQIIMDKIKNGFKKATYRQY